MNLFTNFLENWVLKGFLFLTIYFSPIWISLCVILVFIVVDLISALLRAKKNNIPIRSKRLRDTLGKTVSYFLALLVSHLFQIHFIPFVPVLQAVSVFIASAEIKSIFENLGAVTGLDFWSFIKQRLAGTNNNYHKDNDKI